MFIISCPKCAKPLKAPDHAVGKPVQCVCGQRFICRAPTVSSPAFEVSSVESGSHGMSLLRKRRRPGLEPPVLIAVVLAIAALLGAGIWSVLPAGKGVPVSAEQPALQAIPVSLEPVSLKAVSLEKRAAETTRPATDPAQPPADAAAQLRAAEEKLAVLTDIYDRERKRLVTAALYRVTPDEFRQLLMDMDSGKPEAVVLENEARRNEAEDRGLSPEDHLANTKARTERKRRFHETTMKSFKQDLQNPKSALSLELEREQEALDSTKELRKQMRLAEQLRRNVPAAKMPPDPKAAAAAGSARPSEEPAQPAAGAATQLHAAEQKLAVLKANSVRELRQLTYAHLVKDFPQEFHAALRAISQGAPPEETMAAEGKRIEAEIRRLPPAERQARTKDIEDKIRRSAQLSEEFDNQLKDPTSAVSLEFEGLDSTKELRAQQGLVERLREEAQASKAIEK